MDFQMAGSYQPIHINGIYRGKGASALKIFSKILNRCFELFLTSGGKRTNPEHQSAKKGKVTRNFPDKILNC